MLMVAHRNHVWCISREGLHAAHVAVPLLSVLLKEIVGDVAAVQDGVEGARGGVGDELREARGILVAKVGQERNDGAAGPVRGRGKRKGTRKDVRVRLGDA